MARRLGLILCAHLSLIASTGRRAAQSAAAEDWTMCGGCVYTHSGDCTCRSDWSVLCHQPAQCLPKDCSTLPPGCAAACAALPAASRMCQNPAPEPEPEPAPDNCTAARHYVQKCDQVCSQPEYLAYESVPIVRDPPKDPNPGPEPRCPELPFHCTRLPADCDSGCSGDLGLGKPLMLCHFQQLPESCTALPVHCTRPPASCDTGPCGWLNGTLNATSMICQLDPPAPPGATAAPASATGREAIATVRTKSASCSAPGCFSVASMQPGQLVYCDRNDTLPAEGLGTRWGDESQLIRLPTADATADAGELEWLCFDIELGAAVHVLFVAGAARPAVWLAADYTVVLGETVGWACCGGHEVSMDVWSRHTDHDGRVCTGGNGGAAEQYVVVVTPPALPTSECAARPMVCSELAGRDCDGDGNDGLFSCGGLAGRNLSAMVKPMLCHIPGEEEPEPEPEPGSWSELDESVLDWMRAEKVAESATPPCGCADLRDGGRLGAAYTGATNCRWSLQCPALRVPRLTFSSFGTEANFDFVRIYDGADLGTAPLVANLTGRSLPGPQQATGPTMAVQLLTDASNDGPGFQAIFECLAAPGNCARLPACQPRCDELVTVSFVPAVYNISNNETISNASNLTTNSIVCVFETVPVQPVDSCTALEAGLALLDLPGSGVDDVGPRPPPVSPCPEHVLDCVPLPPSCAGAADCGVDSFPEGAMLCDFVVDPGPGFNAEEAEAEAAAAALFEGSTVVVAGGAGAWSRQSVGWGSAEHLSMAASPNPCQPYHRHIGYAGSPELELRYAVTHGGAGWRQGLADTGMPDNAVHSDANWGGGPRRAVGEFVDIVVDSSGRPHISYTDRANGDLKYASEAGGNWEGVHWRGNAWARSVVDRGNGPVTTELLQQPCMRQPTVCGFLLSPHPYSQHIHIAQLHSCITICFLAGLRRPEVSHRDRAGWTATHCILRLDICRPQARHTPDRRLGVGADSGRPRRLVHARADRPCV